LAIIEEQKVQKALALISSNPGMELQPQPVKHALPTLGFYDAFRVSLDRRVVEDNKKLSIPESSALKDYLLMCQSMGRSASIDNTIAAATRFYGTKVNTILRLTTMG